MWTCPKCERIFRRAKQPHTCQRLDVKEHFKNKTVAQELFNYLVKEINSKIGKCKIISIPCCVHLFGTFDFLAALPKKDRLEIRFIYSQKIAKQRIKAVVPLSAKSYKICLDLKSKKDINKELLSWLQASYNMK